jgi:RES domain-containing protein
VRLWRISNHIDLSGRGGLLAAGRWHRLGTPVVYAADHPSTAMLEVLAHLDLDDVPARYRLMAIEAPDDASRLEIAAEELPTDWRMNVEGTRELGNRLLYAGAHLMIVVPSVLVRGAWNVLMNPRHPEIARCSVAEIWEDAFDPRLVR